MWRRRDFLKMAGAGFAGGLGLTAQEVLARSELLFASAARDPSGRFIAAIINERGEIVRRASLPARGHGLAIDSSGGRFAIFARRPGLFAAVFDRDCASLGTAVARQGRHFYGHGVFSADGRLLFATENDFEAGRGVVGIYDATNDFSRVGEFESYGVGPHDMMWSPDRRMLVVANGGIETHPDFGRTPLNLASMKPNIAFIEVGSGSLISRHELGQEFHQLSLRHVAMAPRGGVWVGAQYMGSGSRPMPLLILAGPDEAAQLIELPEAMAARLDNYVGGLASSESGEIVVATSPTGGAALRYDSVSGDAQLILAPAVCGAALAKNKLYLSTGAGKWRAASGGMQQAEMAFDNHLNALAT